MAVPPPIFSTGSVNPGRGRDRRAGEGPPHALVIHTSEQPNATTETAESLARFIAGPPTGSGMNTNVSSYHWVVDLNSIIHLQKVQYVDNDDWIAYHCPPNWRGEGVCLTGRAARDWTGTSDGVDDWPELELSAHLAAWICQERGWPIKRLTPQQLRNSEKGICGHVDMAIAFGQSDHTDPGVGFPWAWFIQRAQDITDYYTVPIPPPIITPEEDPMWRAVLAAPDRPEVLYTSDGNGAFFVALESIGDRNAVLSTGVARIELTTSQFDRFVASARGDIEI